METTRNRIGGKLKILGFGALCSDFFGELLNVGYKVSLIEIDV